MKYTNEIVINLPLKEVIKKFDSEENIKHWQAGFISLEPITEIQGETGSKAKLKYKMGKREMELIETITHKNLPKEFHGTYETKGVFNAQENYFEEIDANTTKWVSKTEFKFSGFMMKVMGFLMPNAFKKQSCKYMSDFKNFAEKGISVADA
jgi:hypothetical protein